jgi:hypothetical protein
MGFYELGNGCDSCETVGSILPNNVNMQMDPNSAMVASMMMPYNPASNTMQQYGGAVSSGNSGIMGNMGNGSMGGSMGGGMQQKQMAQPAAVKQVTTTVTTTNVPAAVAAPSANSKVEGFVGSANNANNANGSNNMMKSNKHWILLGLVIFTALAGNECCKYFLNKSIQLDGSPMYYVAYVGVAILLTYAAHTYMSTH